MASCVLDLTFIGKTAGIKDPYNVIEGLKNFAWLYTNAESIIFGNTEKITEFFSYTNYDPLTNVLKNPKPSINYVIVDRGNGDIEIIPTDYFLQSILDSDGQLIIAPPIIGDQIFVGHADLMNPNIILSPGTGDRINLEIVGGDPCKKGYYGFIGNKATAEYYQVCFVNPTNPDNVIYDGGARDPYYYRTHGDLPFPVAAYISKIKIDGTTNISTTPTIIQDEISIRSGLGPSIIDDLEACPKDPGVFFATDLDFGEIDFGTVKLGKIELYNRTPSGRDLKLVDISPKNNENFTIKKFTNQSLLTPDPVDINANNSLTIPVNAQPTISFEVEYNPKDEVGVLHQTEITYSVLTTTRNPEVVTQEKIISTLRGSSRNIDIVCSDADWGDIDSNESNNLKDIIIQNNSTTEVYLYDYAITTNGVGQYIIANNVFPTKTNPIRIDSKQSLTIRINYNPNGAEGISKGTMRFYFWHSDEKIEVGGSKLTSYLLANAYRDDIDDVTDDVIDVVTDDDNGTFTVKVLSKILDRITIQKNKTFPLWSCGSDRLTKIYTGSKGVKSDRYYLPVYNQLPTEHGTQHQFDISFGHINGSGSSYYDATSLAELYPSKAMYRKHLLECYGVTSGSTGAPKKFMFRNGVERDYVYFIQLNKRDYKDMLDPGNFELCLAPLSSSANQLYNTGSNFYANPSSSIIYKLIDNSDDTKQDRTDRSGLQSFYYLVSGSLTQGQYGDGTENAWGLVFPKMGLIVLDGTVLDQSCSFNTVTGSINGDNIYKLFLSLSGSMATNAVRQVSESFYARSAENSLIQTFFCRANPDEFNNSTNPTYVSGGTNELKYQSFIREPKTYITTIGLYNKRNELVAIGKLNKPLLKTDKTQYVFQVRVRIK